MTTRRMVQPCEGELDLGLHPDGDRHPKPDRNTGVAGMRDGCRLADASLAAHHNHTAATRLCAGLQLR